MGESGVDQVDGVDSGLGDDDGQSAELRTGKTSRVREGNNDILVERPVEIGEVEGVVEVLILDSYVGQVAVSEDGDSVAVVVRCHVQREAAVLLVDWNDDRSRVVSVISVVGGSGGRGGRVVAR